MNAIDLFLCAFASLYALTLVILAFSLARYRSPRSSVLPVFVSVLVPARNEARRISACLDSLLAQTYEPDRFEVIVISDRSTDETVATARSYENRFTHFKLVVIEEPSPVMAPKKHALSRGIEASRGDILLCTDADCRPDRRWIQTMAACFTEETGMVVGYSPIAPSKTWSVFQNFVALDSLALASVAAATTAWNRTATATGRSLAYRRRTFDEVGGFSRIARFISGDDDLLLQLVRGTRWKVAYAIGPDALVPTDPPDTRRQFIHQRIRQASKGRHYAGPVVAGLVVLYVFNLLLTTYAPWAGLYHTDKMIVLAPWILKIAGEFFLLCVGALRFGKAAYLKLFPLIALLHPVYIVVFGLWGQVGSFEWKADAHSRTLGT